MQLMVAMISFGYFSLKEDLHFTLHSTTAAIVLMLISSFATSSFSLVVCGFIRSDTTLRTFSSIIGALSGFVTGAYIPIGSLSDAAGNVIKSFPISYSASLFRKLFMSDVFDTISYDQRLSLEKFLGYGYVWNEHLTTWSFDLTVLVLFSFICLFVVCLFSHRLMKSTLSERN